MIHSGDMLLRTDRLSAGIACVTQIEAPASVPPAANWDRARTAVMWTLIVAGVVLRLAQFLPERSFWHDEAALACNLSQRSFAQLMEPLDYNQGAPLGFLFAQRAVYLTLGGSERALRLLPFLCGVAALLVFPWVARQYVSVNAVVIALALFALGRPLTYYAGELKQYSGDVLVALILLG